VFWPVVFPAEAQGDQMDDPKTLTKLQIPLKKSRRDWIRSRAFGFAFPLADSASCAGASRIWDRTIRRQARILGMSRKPKFHSKMIKDGRWTVAVSTGYGPVSHVGNFATEEEANRWIATNSKNWPQPSGEP
jgi:hypothetical protein